MEKRTTPTDIAKRAGVSIGTVHTRSAANFGVSEETRRKISDLAKQMDYRPNAVAASAQAQDNPHCGGVPARPRKPLLLYVHLAGPQGQHPFQKRL